MQCYQGFEVEVETKKWKQLKSFIANIISIRIHKSRA